MKTRRSVEISVEREEVILIRKPANRVTAWCAECGRRSPMLALEDAMALTGESSRAIHRQVEAGRIHFAETEAGVLLVCLVSLSTPKASWVSLRLQRDE